MKVLIVSDTHGHDACFLEVVKKEKPLDYIIHLGDIDELEEYIEQVTDTPCYAVRGNNDMFSPLPAESVIMLGRHRALITHGHLYGVSYSTRDLIHYAQGLGCDIVMYGHTHVPELDESRDITVLNPGSLTYPRQPGRKPSYIIAETDDNDDVRFTLKYVEK